MKRRMHINPDWTDYVLTVQWDEMERAVGHAMMPSPKQIEEGLKRFSEVGCGTYGCVFDTRTRGVLLKITTDPSEAAFAAAAMSIGEWPSGMVRYSRVYAFPEELAEYLEGNKVWALWRESADEVGVAHPGPRTRLVCKSLAGVDGSLYEIIDWSVNYEESLRHVENESESLREVSEMLADCHWDSECIKGRYLGACGDEDFHLAIDAAGYLKASKKLGRIACLKPVSDALVFYAHHGMMFGDIHEGNIGLVRRNRRSVLAVVDPGVMIPLRPEYLKVAIDKLPQVERAAANPRGRH